MTKKEFEGLYHLRDIKERNCANCKHSVEVEEIHGGRVMKIKNCDVVRVLCGKEMPAQRFMVCDIWYPKENKGSTEK